LTLQSLLNLRRVKSIVNSSISELVVLDEFNLVYFS